MEIIGHEKQRNFLRKAIENNKLSHAYLFVGQESLGKKTIALEFISFLFKQEIKEITNHPDMIFIQAEEKEIQIFQIRELIRKISFKPSLSWIKAVIIDNAHLMNKQAQTCLLKTLEEPRGNSLLILISHNPQYLLPTILSRVQKIKFNSVEKEKIEKKLLSLGLSEKEKQEISEIALGRPGKALNLASNKQELEIFRKKIKEINNLSESLLYFRFEYVKKLTENLKETINALDIWLYYYRSVFLKNPTKKIKNIINLVETTKSLILNTNVNPRLALERLILEL